MTIPLEDHRFHLHAAYATAPRPFRVAEVRPLTDRITHFRFVPADGSPVTAFRPGSHLIVSAGEHRNAYSLVDDGINPRSYGISVLRLGAGRGSDWMHDRVAPGDVLEIEGPRSMFGPVLNQRHALLVAGGIGVTPILSHARAIARAGATAEIIYSHRPGQGAHLEDLRELAAKPGITLHEVTGPEATVTALRERFADQPLGTHAYACGPASMLETYQEVAAASGWPPARVHLERFTAPEQEPGSRFTATVGGHRLEVAPGVSLLQRLLEAGYAVPNLCRQGVCGECRIPVRVQRQNSRIEHRDLVLSDEEKAAGDTMLCCVSRGTEESQIEVLL